MSSAQEIIHELRPQAQVIKPMEGGVMNNVFRVDSEVIKFPGDAGGQQVLLYEAEILGRLAGKLTLNTPQLKEIASDGSYSILSYVGGEMLSSEEIMALSKEQKNSLAKNIVQSLHEINAALTVDEVKDLVRKHIPWQVPENDFYRSLLTSHEDSKYHQLYNECYERYEHRQNEFGTAQEIVVYGDFHYGNMLFNDKNEMTGLIDFGDVNVGTLVTEARQLYRLGSDIVEDFISESGAEFGSIDLESVKLLAIVHEVWVLMRSESKEPPKDGRDKLARELLEQWLGKNWGEL